MKKVLLIATVQSHIAQFHKPLVKMLHEHGYEVHVAARDNLAEKNGLKLDFVEKVFDIPFARSPFSLKNIKAKKMLKDLLRQNDYEYIHCNTPVGGVLGRSCGKKYRKKGTKIIYTAHGFHFYKGGPKKNWILYYPIEKFYARCTDKLITITEEDRLLSSKHFKTKTYRIHGTGVNKDRFHIISEEEKAATKAMLNLPLDKYIFLVVGELNANKDQITVIKAIEELVETDKKNNLLLLIAGNGPKNDELQNYVREHQLSDFIKFLGYNPQIELYTRISDVVLSASVREGLGNNVIEGMLCGAIVFASFNRGHNELLEHDENYQFIAHDYNKLHDLLINYLNNPNVVKEKIKYNLNKANLYTMNNVGEELEKIYFKN